MHAYPCRTAAAWGANTIARPGPAAALPLLRKQQPGAQGGDGAARLCAARGWEGAGSPSLAGRPVLTLALTWRPRPGAFVRAAFAAFAVA